MVDMACWHRPTVTQGLNGPYDTTNEEWRLLSGHYCELTLGHQVSTCSWPRTGAFSYGTEGRAEAPARRVATVVLTDMPSDSSTRA